MTAVTVETAVTVATAAMVDLSPLLPSGPIQPSQPRVLPPPATQVEVVEYLRYQRRPTNTTTLPITPYLQVSYLSQQAKNCCTLLHTSTRCISDSLEENKLIIYAYKAFLKIPMPIKASCGSVNGRIPVRSHVLRVPKTTYLCIAPYRWMAAIYYIQHIGGKVGLAS